MINIKQIFNITTLTTLIIGILAGEVDKQDIKFAYNNLLKWSKHHLKAFWFHASSNSIAYEPGQICEYFR